MADARALCPGIGIAEADFPGDAAALVALARWHRRFSPWSSPHGDDGVILDITGCAHLFGGETGLMAQIVERLARQGIASRAAIADNPGAAWALARFGRDARTLVPCGHVRKALADLPIAALRLEAETVTLLMRLGLRRIGDLYALPRTALVRRCGARVMLRLDQALGRSAEPLSPLSPEKLRWSRRSFAEPIMTAECIAAAMHELLISLCRRLVEEELGIRQLTLALYRVDSKVEELAIGTALPSRDPRHLRRLIDERLPELDPGLGVEDMMLTAADVEKLAALQLGLGGKAEQELSPENVTDLAVLIDRLANRLGTGSVVRPVIRESHLPERVLSFEPALPGNAGKAGQRPAQPRPVRLLSRPEPIEAMAMVPDDPPVSFRWRRLLHRVHRADGPERIEGEWWQETISPRDYYRVEDEEGHRFWLYRDGSYDGRKAPRWFLHGIFG